MTKQHLKRLATPKSWPIKRKGIVFITRPLPGSRKLSLGLPLNVVLKDLLEMATTTKEAGNILRHNTVLVDGRKITNHRFHFCFMDVLNFVDLKKAYRMIITEKNKLAVVEINNKEADKKLVKINDKKITKGKKLLLVLSDGRNALVDKDEYKTGDSLVVEIPNRKILSTIKLEKGALVFLTGGKHIGVTGTVENIEGKKIFFKIGSEIYETSKKYALVIGKGKAVITL